MNHNRRPTLMTPTRAALAAALSLPLLICFTPARAQEGCPGTGDCYSANGTPGCEDAACCWVVCSYDPFCCDTSWDLGCAQLAAEHCYPACPGTGDCWTPHPTPGCSNEPCCTGVCYNRPSCCEVEWDAECVALAAQLCMNNDDCGSSGLLADGVWVFSTVGATTDGPLHPECGPIGSDIWYEYVAPSTGDLIVSTCGSADFDTVIAVYKPAIGIGYTCPGSWVMALLGCNDDAGLCELTSQLTVPVVSGGLYRIRIAGFQGAQGNGTFSVRCVPGNDDCGDAFPIGNGSTYFSTNNATTDGASHATCSFCCTDEQISSDIWYLYTATCTGTLTVRTCEETFFDTRLAVYQPTEGIGWPCPDGWHMALMACSDDAPGCGAGSAVQVPVQAGREYRIRVGGADGASGAGRLDVACWTTGDVNYDGVVGVDDLLAVIMQWGPCPGTVPCSADVDHSGGVDVDDLLLVIMN
ncbi:MAG: hypothetical protein ACYTJ0_00590 [Planctomycetota bacterium]|jgi:hypothetical protein